MQTVLYYLLKISVSLSVVFLFYHFVLRKLTFYNWNRWFLLGYSALSFIIPFVNIGPVLEKNNWTASNMISWVPVMEAQPGASAAADTASLSVSGWVFMILVSGMLLMLLRLLLQFISFRKMMRKAVYISGDDMKLYEVKDPIMPFSFGNAIFINRQLHTEQELQDIIRHEFVHIRQRHSIDILWTEWLCLVNWFNPFAWLLKRSIRQNLEFIADQQVLEHGINKKEYQYLLLKVTGNNQYSIATPFNFSSLKKRIAMMNKLRTARIHLVRFLFVLPLLAVLLLAFRNKWTEKHPSASGIYARFASIVYDKSSGAPLSGVEVTDLRSGEKSVSDAAGYFEMKFDISGQREIQFSLEKEGYQQFVSSHVFDERYTSKPIGVVTLWEMIPGNRKQFCKECKPVSYLNYSSNPQLGMQEAKELWEKHLKGVAIKGTSDELSPSAVLIRDTTPAIPGAGYNEKGYQLSIADAKGNCTVVIRDKTNTVVKKLLLTDWNERPGYYEGLYGALPPPPPPPPPGHPVAVEGMPLKEFRVVSDAPAPPAVPVKLPAHVSSIKIHNDKALVELKNGKTETYMLDQPDQLKMFEQKYGQRPAPPAPPKNVQGQPINEKSRPATPEPPKTVYIMGSPIIEEKKLNSQVLVFIDGKKANMEELKNFPSSRIKSMNVLKGPDAIAKYGTEGKEGVIEIITREEAAKDVNGTDKSTDKKEVIVTGYPLPKAKQQ